MSTQVFHETLCPSGRAVRFINPDIATFLDIEDAAAKGKAGTLSNTAFQREQVIRLLKQYTDPVKIQRKAMDPAHEAAVNAILESAPGKALPEAAQDALLAAVRGGVDVDATLSAVPESAWRQTNYLTLAGSGTESLSALFTIRDFLHMQQVLGEVMMGGGDPLDAKARVVSVG
jgi:hypothetical protein